MVVVVVFVVIPLGGNSQKSIKCITTLFTYFCFPHSYQKKN